MKKTALILLITLNSLSALALNIRAGSRAGDFSDSASSKDPYDRTIIYGLIGDTMRESIIPGYCDPLRNCRFSMLLSVPSIPGSRSKFVEAKIVLVTNWLKEVYPIAFEGYPEGQTVYVQPVRPEEDPDRIDPLHVKMLRGGNPSFRKK